MLNWDKCIGETTQIIARKLVIILLIASAAFPSCLRADASRHLNRISEFTEDDTIRTLAAQFQTDPSSKAFFGAFKRYFPDRYMAMIRVATAAIRTGNSPEQGRMIGLSTVRAFVAENTRNIAFASTSSLVAYAHAQVKLFEAMQRDNEITCAMYSMAQAPKGGSGPNSRAIGDATSAVAVIMLQAAREGIDHPSSRIFQVLTESEQANFTAALIAQFKGRPRLLQIAINGPALLSASKNDQCAVGAANAKAIASLSDELVAKVIAKALTGT